MMELVHLLRYLNLFDDSYNINSMNPFLLREFLESGGVKTTRDLIVFGNEIVYSTKEEAEEELKKEVNDTLTHVEQKSVDWEKALKDLAFLKREYDKASEEEKEDLATLAKRLKNIANPLSDNIDWKQVRMNASISILNSLLETTKHSVLEEVAVNEIYAKIAIAYADSLVKELKRSEALFEENLKKI